MSKPRDTAVDAGPATGNQAAPPAITEWKILVVDDEEDIVAVTRYVLRDFRFRDLPVKVFSAATFREARTILEKEPDIAIVLIDVVMETENSGLELVNYIRKDLGYLDTYIIVRTGQPGVAPEERIILEYEINDYRSKAELTDTRFLTAVVSGLRTWESIRRARGG